MYSVAWEADGLDLKLNSISFLSTLAFVSVKWAQ